MKIEITCSHSEHSSKALALLFFARAFVFMGVIMNNIWSDYIQKARGNGMHLF